MDHTFAKAKKMNKKLRFFVTAIVLCIFLYWLFKQPINWYNWWSVEVIISLLGPILLPFLLAVLWWRLLPVLDAQKLNISTVFNIQSVSWLGRYLPAKAGLYLGKIYLGNKQGLHLGSITKSILYENIFFIGSGLVISSFLAAERLTFISPVSLMVTIFFTVITLPFVVEKLSPYFAPDIPKLDLKRAYSTFCLYIFVHLLLGSLHYLFFISITGCREFPPVDFVAITSAANTLGILAFFIPAGIGVREGIYLLLLGDELGADAAINFALQSRVWMTIGDLFVLLVFLFCFKKENSYVKKTI